MQRLFWLLLVVSMLAVACSRPGGDALQIQPVVYGPDTARVGVDLGPDYVDGSLEVMLDGNNVSDRMVVRRGAARGAFGVGGGPHMLAARARFREQGALVWRSDIRFFVAADPLPPLLASEPASGSIDVPRTEWLRLTFARDLSERARESVELACDGETLEAAVHALGPRDLVVNPDADLPAAASCSLAWRGSRGAVRIAFATAGEGFPVFVRYNRADPHATAPFPDDFWLKRDADDPSQRRLAIQFSGFGELDQLLLDAFTSGTRSLDGFSPIAHLTVALSEAPDPESLPRTPRESLDPTASVGLFHVDPRSAAYGRRVPFRLEVRNEATDGADGHSLLIFPSLPLEPSERYGLVVTRRVRASAARPFAPSLFFHYVRDTAASPGEPAALTRVRSLANDVLTAVETAVHPPIPREDVALALRFTVRSTDDIPNDLVAIREEVFAAPPPEVVVESVEREDPEQVVAGSQVGAIVKGSWLAPDWRGADLNLLRDPETGRPQRTGVRPLDFVLALPRDAFDGPVPVTFYQHGNPGSAEEEVVAHARASLAREGFAVIGFTDAINREVSPPGPDTAERARRQISDLFVRLLFNRKVPDYFVQTNGEQIAFLRAIEVLREIDGFEFDESEGAGGPRVIHGIDPQLPLTYVGISEGANLAPALLPYAPEIRAAALVAGGRRFSEVLIHQQGAAFLGHLQRIGFLDLSPTDTWVALALFQTLFDPQDGHNHAPFLYRTPVDLAGGDRRASVLLAEGLDDSFVPNHATESLAWALGEIPVLEPAPRAPAFAPVARAPLTGNIDALTTAALYQFVPEGVPGIRSTPGCRAPRVSDETAHEGHWCVQSAEEALLQRAIFLESALGDGAPTIIDPLAE